MSQKLQLPWKYQYLQTAILPIIHFITCLNKSSLDCWLLITVQKIVVVEQNKFNVLYISAGIKKNYEHTFSLFVYLLTLLKKRILETN